MEDYGIVAREFYKWASDTWVRYASCTTYDDLLLKFEVSLNNKYRVVVGSVVQYNGTDFITAMKTYNERI